MSARRGPDPHERGADSGLQAERTYLAWQRTGLTFAGVGALLVRLAGGAGDPVAAIPGLFGLAMAALVLLRAFVRYRSADAAARGERHAAAGNAMLFVAAGTAVLALSGLVITLR